VLGAGLAIVMFAGLMSGAPLAIGVMLLAAVSFGLVSVAAGVPRGRNVVPTILLVFLLLIIFALSSRHPAARNLLPFATGSPGDGSAGLCRLLILQHVQDAPLLGTGAATQNQVAPIYGTAAAVGEQVNSGYLHVLRETGAVGFSLLLVGIGVVGNWCRQALQRATDLESRLMAGAVTTSLLVCVVHWTVVSLWYVPACMVVAIVLAACAFRLSRLATRSESGEVPVRFTRPLGLAGAFGVTVLAFVIMLPSWSGARAASHWRRLARLSNEPLSNEPLLASTPDHSADESAELASRLEKATSCLEHVLRANPRDARAHARLADLYVKRFELQQRSRPGSSCLQQIRDFALKSNFTSVAAQRKWLEGAFPASHQLLTRALTHAQRAARLSPLQSKPYLCLAQLGFLAGDGRSAKWAYFDQAARVRPHSDEVWMATGCELARERDLQQAIACWKHVFPHRPDHRERIFQLCAAHLPARTVLAAFQPDAAGARVLFQHYRDLGFKPQAHVAGRYFLDQLSTEASRRASRLTATQWRDAFAVQDYLGDDVAALASLRNAVRLSPGHYDTRHELADRLLSHQEYAEARGHLQWCLQHRPDDPQLRRDLQMATLAEAAPLLR
jgi:cytochrome c-type biogenesis protein CcmH/NrfG